MKTFPCALAIAASLFTSGMGTAFGGQALAATVDHFLKNAGLVAVVEVKKVTEVEVATGSGSITKVYVAEAEVQQTLKPDLYPVLEKRSIAIVGSTIPMSSAVWRPIEKKRYLAFLQPEQGHYRYGEKYAMRPISPEGKVEWMDKDEKGHFRVFDLDLEEAVQKIRREQAVVPSHSSPSSPGPASPARGPGD